MSDEENFLARWSRRKREAEEQEPAPAPEPATVETETGGTKEGEVTSAAKESDAAEPGATKFDLASLPPIESIGPDTDIRPFLRPGVPADLTRAALRRAWSVDPAIRDYIGPSENSWDFTAAGANGVPGFDFGDPGVDVRRLASQLFGRDDEPPQGNSPPSRSEVPAEDKPAKALAVGSAPTPEDHNLLKAEVTPDNARLIDQRFTAPQQEPVSRPAEAKTDSDTKVRVPRRHGGALPT